jgi:pantoate--beta-alanine ligase
MRVIEKVSELAILLEQIKNSHKKTGFVPTMGALHEGHLELIRNSKKENDLTIASIFVNPLQFNNNSDYINYPQTLSIDIQLLEKEGCDFLFSPTKDDLFSGYNVRDFDLGGLDTMMEGAFRPGHFQGVANVVFRLFEIIHPSQSYFGLKDYQQYLIIKRLASDYFPEINIKDIETVREESGLAMSSRNLRLTVDQRKIADLAAGHILDAVNMADESTFPEVKKWLENEMKALPGVRLEYFEFAEYDTLQIVEEKGYKQIRAFCAFFVGDIRLIDNLPIRFARHLTVPF